MGHTGIEPGRERRSLNRDDSTPLYDELYERCPAAWDRLDRFRWEYVADQAFRDLGWGEEPADREDCAREWLRMRGWPVSVERGVNEDGLRDAALVAATSLQGVLYELDGPADLGWALALDGRRWMYLRALRYLGGNRLAKDDERRVSPHAQPLAICVGGTSKKSIVTLTRTGIPRTYRLGHVGGCGSTFPDAPYGPGRRWPTWCPACATAKSNGAARAQSELKRRAASGY